MKPATPAERYLEDEVDPVLAPLLRQILASSPRPRGKQEIAAAIGRCAKAAAFAAATDDATGSWPSDPGGITTDFLSAIFDAEVTSFESKLVGLGVIGDAHKITLTFQKPGAGPASCIIKLPKGDKDWRKKNVFLYEKEVLWYKNYADRCPLKMAKCYASCFDPAYTGNFCLVFEDLSAEGLDHFGSWFVTGVKKNVVEEAAKSIAGMSAFFFESEHLRDSVFVPKVDASDPMVARMQDAGWVVGNIDALKWWEEWPDSEKIVGEAGLSGAETLRRLMWKVKDVVNIEYTHDGKKYIFPEGPGGDAWFTASMMGPDSKDIFIECCRWVAERPHSVIHGDAHAGNVFFNNDTGECTWIDFQIFQKAPPGFELGQMWLSGGGVDSSHDLTSLMHLARVFYDELVKKNPAIKETYSFDMCVEDGKTGELTLLAILPSAFIPLWLSFEADSNPETNPMLGAMRAGMPRFTKVFMELDFEAHAQAALARLRGRS